MEQIEKQDLLKLSGDSFVKSIFAPMGKQQPSSARGDLSFTHDYEVQQIWLQARPPNRHHKPTSFQSF